MRIEKKKEEVNLIMYAFLFLMINLIFQSLQLISLYLQEKPPAPIKALAVPHFLPFQPKPPVKSQVEMCPFSFEERERERRAVKEKKLEELRNDEVFSFWS